MIWIVGTIVLALLAIGGLLLAPAAVRAFDERRPYVQEGDAGQPWSWAGFAFAGLVVALWAIWSLTRAYHPVPAGNEGLVYGIGGNIVGQREAGAAWIAPWQTFRLANVQVQTLAFNDDEREVPDDARHIGSGLDSFTSETQSVYIDAILVIRVSPENVQGLYREVGPGYVNKLIPGRVAQIFKDETVNYSAVEIAPARELIRANVERQLRSELQRYSIEVDALLIDNITFDPEFAKSILDKQTATQDALKAQEQVAQREAEARQREAEATGRANSLRIEAEGQAAANREIAASLTPALIQFQAVQKLADNVTIALIPSGDGVLIDPTTLLGSSATP